MVFSESSAFSRRRIAEAALGVGDYCVIYTFDAERNAIHLLAVGNRREIYRDY